MTVQEPPARKRTHYQVLMLDQDVDDEVLTEVYRRLVQRVRLAEVDEGRRARLLRSVERAYSVLHDPIRRSLYDLELEERASDGAADEVRGRVAVPVADPTASSVATPPARASLPVARPVVSAARPSTTSTPGARVLDFGRYAGWTLRQIALRDRDYLEWLRRTPLGRQYQAEIAALLAPR